ncbi:2Fe-2S iron-sulfur cluster binding domain-containing protein [Paenibacillus sp. LMG 31458]|uniref:2Fe-2S iron-sulfur cluster binding domain-containing protein n=1 Tax=Paenibacillus phytorum TaxID=2654977 RepID=A0ABX1XYQ5_9BACL|nr:(2Fe-2S)-binding protein [Paenibacillus phytorum]NOU73702.1 2Fe-2S iron-sulfur cluster binding domain-containing protein [Paenibacillus phytorum]
MKAHGTVKSEIELLVNGKRQHAVIRSSDTLLRVLRKQLGLTGAKAGCENGDCGACTVIVDGVPIKSCLMLAIEVQGGSVTTVEGLGGDALIQRAFVDKFAFQCGFCTPGFIMVCHALVNRYPNAGEEVIQEWLQSNICRCTSYEEIHAAVRSVINHE